MFVTALVLSSLVAGAVLVSKELNRIPVTVQFSRALLTDSLVMTVENHSHHVLNNVVVTVKNPRSGRIKSWTVDSLGVGLLDKTQTFGRWEGWNFEPGDTVTIEARGFSPLKLVVP